MRSVGILGSGTVGRTLGSGFLKHGYAVMIGSREPSKLDDWLAENPSGMVGDFTETAAFANIVVLAGKGTAADAILKSAGPENLAGKVIIDATNPLADTPPEDGVLKFFTTLEDSLMERLQREFPEARFVKAFNSVGAHLMVNPKLSAQPTMFICGDDAAAKGDVTNILDLFGWETVDLGSAAAARAIEPLCILWCIPGFLHNEWVHALKLVRP